jgi:hypothetical protein
MQTAESAVQAAFQERLKDLWRDVEKRADP